MSCTLYEQQRERSLSPMAGIEIPQGALKTDGQGFFLSGSVVKTAYQCRRHGLDPLGQEDPTCSGTTKPQAPQLLRLCTSAREPRLLSPACHSFRSPNTVEPAPATREAATLREITAMRSPYLPQLEKTPESSNEEAKHSPRSNV